MYFTFEASEKKKRGKRVAAEDGAVDEACVCERMQRH